MNTPDAAWKAVVRSGAVVGLAIMGDSLLYAVLPLEAPRWGWAPTTIGLVLSVNRVVRLATNTLVGMIFARVGPYWPFTMATLLAALTTGLYGLPTSPETFVGARAAWGLAWSGLRQGGYQTVWAVPARLRGRMMGIFWGLVRLGSAVSAIIGGLIRDRLGYTAAVIAVTGAAWIAVPLAWRFPWPPASQSPTEERPSFRGLFRVWGEPGMRWAMLAGMTQAILESVLVATTAVFVAQALPEAFLPHVGLVTGLFVATRWLSDVLLGPALGTLADRIGPARLALSLAAATLAVLVGLVRRGNGWALVGFGLVLMINAGLIVALATLANTEALRTPAPHLGVAAYTTGIDFGLAVGPMLGYTLGVQTSLTGMYAGIAFALVGLTAGYLWRRKNAHER